MWNWLRQLINRLFGLGSEITSKGSPETSTPTEECPDVPLVTPSETKTELTPYQEIDWLEAPPQYHKRKSILTFPEREFYRLLRGQVGNNYHVFPSVRMGDVLWLENETDNRKFLNNQIQCKHFDYVVCDKLKFEPVFVVELDDDSHEWPGRWRSDEFKDRACKVAGLPVLRIKVQQDFDRAEIGKEVREILRQWEGTVAARH